MKLCSLAFRSAMFNRLFDVAGQANTAGVVTTGYAQEGRVITMRVMAARAFYERLIAARDAGLNTRIEGQVIFLLSGSAICFNPPYSRAIFQKSGANLADRRSDAVIRGAAVDRLCKVRITGGSGQGGIVNPAAAVLDADWMVVGQIDADEGECTRYSATCLVCARPGTRQGGNGAGAWCVDHYIHGL